MRRTLAVVGAVALLGTALPVQAQQPRAVFAVLPFENSGSYGQDKEVFEALGLGIPAMLAGALGRHPGAGADEPRRVAQALAGLGLGPGQRIDAAGAAQAAKAAGARYAVTGSFSDFYGKLRVNARVVDAQSGEILKVVANDDARTQDRARLGAIVGQVSGKIAASAGLPEDEGPAAEVPTEAIVDFSRGLLYESRGDVAKAMDFFQRAVTAAPGFPEAQAGLQRVRGG
jgi:hypothetical protein